MSQPPRSYVETSFGCLAYRRCGKGRPVVLIHGSLVTADDMVLALMDTLSRTYDVLAFDRPGHGGSDQTLQAEGSPYAQAEMLLAGWTALGIERPVLLGHSFGGAVALSAAIAAPETVAGIVALAPICFPETRLEHLLLGPRAAPVYGDLIGRTIGAVTDAATLPLLRNSMFFPQLMPASYSAKFPFAWVSHPDMMNADGKDSVGMLAALTRSAASYINCRVPAEFLAGTHDLVVLNIKHGFTAAAMMPQARFSWIVGFGHMMHHFQQDLIQAAVSRTFAAGPSA